MLMKTLLLLFLAIAADAQSTNSIFLTWTVDPGHDSNVTFIVYSQTNIATPVAEWKAATNVAFNTFTNGNKLNIPVGLLTPVFYAVTASNVAGESAFSETAVVRLPAAAKKLGIGRN